VYDLCLAVLREALAGVRVSECVSVPVSVSLCIIRALLAVLREGLAVQ